MSFGRVLPAQLGNLSCPLTPLRWQRDTGPGHGSRTQIQDTDPGLPVTPALCSVSPAEQGPLSRRSPLESPSQRHHSPILPEAEGFKPLSTALSVLQIQSLLHPCFPALYPLPVPLKTYS